VVTFPEEVTVRVKKSDEGEEIAVKPGCVDMWRI